MLVPVREGEWQCYTTNYSGYHDEKEGSDIREIVHAEIEPTNCSDVGHNKYGVCVPNNWNATL